MKRKRSDAPVDEDFVAKEEVEPETALVPVTDAELLPPAHLDMFGEDHLRRDIARIRNASGVGDFIKEVISSAVGANGDIAVIRRHKQVVQELTKLTDARRDLEYANSRYDDIAIDNGLRRKRMEVEFATSNAEIQEQQTRAFKASIERQTPHGDNEIKEKEKQLKLAQLELQIAKANAEAAAVQRQGAEPVRDAKPPREAAFSKRVVDKVNSIVEELEFESALKRAGSALGDGRSPEDQEFINRQVRKRINEERER